MSKCCHFEKSAVYAPPALIYRPACFCISII